MRFKPLKENTCKSYVNFRISCPSALYWAADSVKNADALSKRCCKQRAKYAAGWLFLLLINKKMNYLPVLARL